MRLLAISGSLRAVSSNTALLRAAARLAPEGMEVRLIGGEEFVYKPVALLNASPRATHAQASLMETVKTMSGRLVAEASIDVPLLGRNLDERGIIEDPEISASIREALAAFERYLICTPC